jgi:hypothetical protein
VHAHGMEGRGIPPERRVPLRWMPRHASIGRVRCALSVRSAVPAVPRTTPYGTHIYGHFRHSGHRVVGSSPTRLTTNPRENLKIKCSRSPCFGCSVGKPVLASAREQARALAIVEEQAVATRIFKTSIEDGGKGGHRINGIRCSVAARLRFLFIKPAGSGSHAFRGCL